MSYYTKEELMNMSQSGELLLKGKRWFKFHEFTIWIVVIGAGFCTGVILRIVKVGFIEWWPLPLFLIPILFIVWWIPYRRKRLRLHEVSTTFTRKENHEFVVRAIKQLDWHIKYDSVKYIEATDDSQIGTTWGDNMIFALIYDNKILLNCQTDLSALYAQAVFTFGKLTRNVRDLENAVLNEINKTEMDD